MFFQERMKAEVFAAKVVLASLALASLTLGFFAQPAIGQVATKLGDQFIPLDGVVMFDVHPADIVKSETLRLLPMEIAEAWSLDNIGVAPSQCKSMRFVMASPAMGPQLQPFAAMIVQLNEPFKVTDLNPQLLFEDPEEIDGHTCYVMKGPQGVVFHQPDPQTIILSSSSYLDAVLSASQGGQPGPLAKLAAAVSNKGQVTMLLAIEPVRPMINGGLQMVGQQLPPPLMPFLDIPNLLDALLIRLDVEDTKKGLQISMLAKDDASAEKLETIMLDGFDMGKGIALGELEKVLIGEGAIPDATRAYGNRIAEKLTGIVKPDRKGRTLTYRVSPSLSLLMPAFIAGISVPIQQAQFAAQRANRGNNAGDSLKNLGLAMHNYHSAYNKLPASVNRDSNGKPLLSWRVHILPFIEEQGLYQQFHMDEPWDSEHNIKLLDQMPAYFSHPDFDVAVGKTVFQVPIGDDVMFNTEQQTRFREVLDGLSNTIMIATSDAQSAVEWSKPQDLEIDLDNPAKSLGMVNGTTSVMMGDGALQRIDASIDSQTLKALFTHAGGEAIR